MHLIIYISDYLGSNIAKDCGDILRVSSFKNPMNRITGVLFYHNRKFMQVIEGKKEDVKRLIAKIMIDKRHCNMTIMIDQSITERSYSGWNMDSFVLYNDDEVNKQLASFFFQE